MATTLEVAALLRGSLCLLPETGMARRLPPPILHSPQTGLAFLDRRQFLKSVGVAGASAAALGGVLSCRSRDQTYVGGADPGEREVALLALDEALDAGARYADVRISAHQFEAVAAREQRITEVSSTESYGLGLRALVGGSWGFSATRDVSRSGAVGAAREAVAMATANDRVAPQHTELAPVDIYPDVYWETPHRIDPFAVAIEEKADLLFRTNAAALGVDGVEFVASRILSVKEKRLVATSEGSVIQQTFLRINPSVTVSAVAPDRSDFQSRGAVVEPSAGGWEYVLGLDLPAKAPRWGEEAVMKLKAARVEPGRWDLILHPSNLWLTIHESIGHPTELDRALGYEANYAGTSFLAPPQKVLNQLRLGPDFMHFVGNRTEEGGCATCGWDDEGVPAQAWPIVQNGIFVDYQTTREQAAWISDLTGVSRSHGCAYGQNWSSIPFQRMPNVSLRPGDEDVDEQALMARADRAILIEGRGSYSIDQQRFNLQFGGQVFWEIRGGRKHRMLRDLAYVSRTPDFWGSLAALGGAATYYLGASFGDAKGQPGQSNAVSHGCPMALFRGIEIINTA